MEKRPVDLMRFRNLLQAAISEQNIHLGFEGPGKEPVNIMVAVVGKNKSAMLHIFFEMIGFPGIELHQFVSTSELSRLTGMR